MCRNLVATAQSLQNKISLYCILCWGLRLILTASQRQNPNILFSLFFVFSGMGFCFGFPSPYSQPKSKYQISHIFLAPLCFHVNSQRALSISCGRAPIITLLPIHRCTINLSPSRHHCTPSKLFSMFNIVMPLL